MQFTRWKTETFIVCSSLLAILVIPCSWTHEAKDFDDSILYQIEFDIPDFEKNPDLRNQLQAFYTHDKEKYDCVIPVVEDAKEEKKPGEVEISPLTLIRPIFSASSCSYRIEAYWSYEICHGYHIRQYHEEREGKNIKFQEYYLGKWSEEKTEQITKALETTRLAGIKHRTTRIDSIKYPYFEMEMTDGTLCDIINEPRTTKIRYVCYPHGKNEIYSFKETSSCNYEAIILTSLLCKDPAFHPEDSKEVPIKCFNSPTDTHKPLSMLRQELNEFQLTEADLPASKDVNGLVKPAYTGDRFTFVSQFGANVDKLVQDIISSTGVVLDLDNTGEDALQQKSTQPPIADLSPIKDMLSGQNCLTGGTGWWKYEFCHRVHVRQIHKDKKSETEIFLGYFDEMAHRQWMSLNPDKAFKKHGSTSIWHHYEGGSRCDRTGKPREVDVKLTCTPIASTPTTVSMYLLEPKTCQYILVVESPIICDLMQITDEFGFVDADKYQQLLQENAEKHSLADKATAGSTEQVESSHEMETTKSERGDLNPSGATGTVSEISTEEEEAHD